MNPPSADKSPGYYRMSLRDGFLCGRNLMFSAHVANVDEASRLVMKRQDAASTLGAREPHAGRGVRAKPLKYFIIPHSSFII